MHYGFTLDAVAMKPSDFCNDRVNFANEAGIANEKIWVDGIVTPVNIQQPQLLSLMEFQKMIPDMSSLSKEMQDYAKTYNVIMGETFYSDSWLEV